MNTLERTWPSAGLGLAALLVGWLFTRRCPGVPAPTRASAPGSRARARGRERASPSELGRLVGTLWCALLGATACAAPARRGPPAIAPAPTPPVESAGSRVAARMRPSPRVSPEVLASRTLPDPGGTEVPVVFGLWRHAERWHAATAVYEGPRVTEIALRPIGDALEAPVAALPDPARWTPIALVPAASETELPWVVMVSALASHAPPPPPHPEYATVFAQRFGATGEPVAIATLPQPTAWQFTQSAWRPGPRHPEGIVAAFPADPADAFRWAYALADPRGARVGVLPRTVTTTFLLADRLAVATSPAGAARVHWQYDTGVGYTRRITRFDAAGDQAFDAAAEAPYGTTGDGPSGPRPVHQAVLAADGVLHVLTTLGGEQRSGGMEVETFAPDGRALATRVLPVEGMTTVSNAAAVACGGRVWVLADELSPEVGGRALRAFALDASGPVPDALVLWSQPLPPEAITLSSRSGAMLQPVCAGDRVAVAAIIPLDRRYRVLFAEWSAH